MAKKNRIRVVALAVIVHEGRVLLQEYRDGDNVYYRPLGGGVEFGEPATVATARELMEEISAELTDVRYLATIENIYSHDDVHAHQIAMLCSARFADPAFYRQSVIIGAEGDGGEIRAVWKSPDDFRAEDAPPLYPPGLLALLDDVMAG